MKLKKRTKPTIDKNAIYRKDWSWWIKIGTPDTRENKLFWRKNKGKDGSWFLDLLLDSLLETEPEETKEPKPSKEYQQQEQLSELKSLIPDTYSELEDNPELEDKDKLIKRLQQKLQEQDRLYQEVQDNLKNNKEIQ